MNFSSLDSTPKFTLLSQSPDSRIIQEKDLIENSTIIEQTELVDHQSRFIQTRQYSNIGNIINSPTSLQEKLDQIGIDNLVQDQKIDGVSKTLTKIDEPIDNDLLLKLSELRCRRHPNEAIQRICNELYCIHNPLVCFQCGVDEIKHIKMHKHYFIPLIDFLKKASKQYENIKNRFDEVKSGPLQYSDFFIKHNIYSSKIKTLFDIERENIDKYFMKIKKYFEDKLMSKRQIYLNKINNMEKTLESNFNYFYSRFSKFYPNLQNETEAFNDNKKKFDSSQLDNNNLQFPSLSNLINSIIIEANKNDKSNIESFIKQVREECTEEFTQIPIDEKLQIMQNQLTSLGDILQEQFREEILIIADFDQTKNSLDHFFDTIDERSSMTRYLDFSKLAPIIDTKILTTNKEQEVLKD